jgi:hypothetical protein
MNTRTQLAFVAVAIAIVTTAVVGVLVSTDEAEAGTQQMLRIPAAAFTPTSEDISFDNGVPGLWNAGSGTATFVAPVLLEGNWATVQSVKLHYYDNGPDRICVRLMRPNLKAGGERLVSAICTRNAVNDARTRVDTTIKSDTFGPNAAAYVFVSIPPGGPYGLYGVTIVYTPDTATG